MKKKLDRLNIEFDEGFDDTPEKAQQYNFMAYMYLYWKFEERPNAFASLSVLKTSRKEQIQSLNATKLPFTLNWVSMLSQQNCGKALQMAHLSK